MSNIGDFHKRLVIVLGSDREISLFVKKIVEIDPNLVVVQASYGEKSRSVDESRFVRLIHGGEMEQLEKFTCNYVVVGVVNRVDSYIPLWGRVVEKYGLAGVKYADVMEIKNKWQFDQLVRRIGLEKYRPRTRVVKLGELEKSIDSQDLPVVVKPYVGSKSRGVFVVRELSEVAKARLILERHFRSEKMFRGVESEELILIEEFVDGKQITMTGWVDTKGKFSLVGFEDVVTGKDMGQRHKQLVFRRVPSHAPEWVGEQMIKVMKELVKAYELKSTFLFPEFIYTNEGRLILIELNVRAGGFRSDLYRLASGVDMRKMIINLALGKEIGWRGVLRREVAACEVWRDESGVVEKLVIPKSDKIKYLPAYKKVGERYIAPPESDEPLAGFFVVDKEDALEKAKEIFDKIDVQLKMPEKSYE